MQTAVSISQEEEKPLPRRRRRLPISFILGGLAILGAVIYLVYANTQANAVYYFTISDGGHTLPVVYSGIVPDIFRPGITVVVEGHYTGQGPFQAQTLLAKCPSKFQAATPGP